MPEVLTFIKCHWAIERGKTIPYSKIIKYRSATLPKGGSNEEQWIRKYDWGIKDELGGVRGIRQSVRETGKAERRIRIIRH